MSLTSGLPTPSGTGSDHEDAAAAADHVFGGGDAFDALVEGHVERVASTGGDDGVGGLIESLRERVADPIDTGAVGSGGLACEDGGDAAVVGEGDVDQEIVAG